MQAPFIILVVSLCQFRVVWTEECHRETKFLLVEQDGLPLINPIKTVEATNSFSCSTACAGFQGCNSFAFLTKKAKNNCKLSNNVDGVSVSSGVKAKVYKKIKNATKGCEGNPCLNGVRCVDIRGEPYHGCFPRRSCKEIYDQGERQDGVYFIDPDGQGMIQVRCDMTRDGGGWTVFQRRLDGSVDFYRNWIDYKNGFGDASGEFWLGFEKIRRILNSKQHTLRVDLEDFEGRTAYAKYSQFRIDDEAAKYKLTASGYSGDAGNSLGNHSGRKFSTKDSDSDTSSKNCAVQDVGAWWYGSCNESNLNGVYHSTSSASFNEGLQWQHWKGNYYSLKRAEMKFRSN